MFDDLCYYNSLWCSKKTAVNIFGQHKRIESLISKYLTWLNEWGILTIYSRPALQYDEVRFNSCYDYMRSSRGELIEHKDTINYKQRNLILGFTKKKLAEYILKEACSNYNILVVIEDNGVIRKSSVHEFDRFITLPFKNNNLLIEDLLEYEFLTEQSIYLENRPDLLVDYFKPIMYDEYYQSKLRITDSRFVCGISILEREDKGNFFKWLRWTIFKFYLEDIWKSYITYWCRCLI